MPPSSSFAPNLNRASQQGERKAGDVLNPVIPDFTTLRHILTFPERIKKVFSTINGFANNFLTKEGREKRETLSYSSRRDTSNHMNFDPERLN